MKARKERWHFILREQFVSRVKLFFERTLNI